MCHAFALSVQFGNRKMDRDGRAPVLAFARGLENTAIGGEECIGDPQAETGTGGRLDVTAAAPEALAHSRGFLGGETGASVGDRKDHVAVLASSAQADGRTAFRIFDCV